MNEDNDPATDHAADHAYRRLAAIYDRHHRQVHAYALSRAGGTLADDVVSETFLVALRRVDEIPSDALPWLLGTARRVILSGYRREARQASIAAQMQVWVEEATRDVADGVAERAVTLTALAGLSDQDRELLTLLAWHDLSPAEAAKLIGCSRATFFVRLHRARKRFEQAVADAGKPLNTRPRRVIDGPRTAQAR